MSRDRDYQHLLNSRRWAETRQKVWERAKGLCEECREQGIITPGVDCHHIVPVETAHNLQEMKALCFDTANIRLLCIPHHIEVHTKERSHSKEAHRQREDDRLERWKARQGRRPTDG